MRQSTTASHEIPLVAMSLHAVIAMIPPTVLFALHLFRSPLVLKISVTSSFPNRERIGFNPS